MKKNPLTTDQEFEMYWAGLCARIGLDENTTKGWKMTFAKKVWDAAIESQQTRIKELEAQLKDR